MPYKNAKRKYRKKKYPRRSRLRDKKINTLVEKRMSQIAKKEAKKARAKSYKDYHIGSFTANGLVNSTTTLTASPDSMILALYPFVVQTSTTSNSSIGYRLNDFVWMRGFTVSGVLQQAASANDMSEVRVRFCLISQKRQADPLANQVLTDLPSPLLFNRLNGAKPTEDQITDRKSIKVLHSKLVRIKPRGKYAINQPFSMSYYFKSPQKQTFDPSDTQGANPLNRTYWLSAYCDKDISSSDSKITFAATVRVHYFQE